MQHAATIYALLAFAFSFALSGRVAAQTSENLATPSSSQAKPAENPALSYNLPVDLGVTIGSGTLALSLSLLSSKLAPEHCRWCDRDANGRDTLNGFDASIRDSLRWSNTKLANSLSNLSCYGIAPLISLGAVGLSAWKDGRAAELPVDGLIVAESVLVAMNVNQLTKLAFARERPFVNARTPAEREALRSSEDNVSYYSGHTSFAFSVAVAAGTVASMRRYKLAPWVWASGLALGVATGYLRIAADRHYATDVVSGAVIGSAVGFAIPYFGHRASPTSVRLAAMQVTGGSGLIAFGAF